MSSVYVSLDDLETQVEVGFEKSHLVASYAIFGELTRFEVAFEVLGCVFSHLCAIIRTIRAPELSLYNKQAIFYYVTIACYLLKVSTLYTNLSK